MADRKCIPEVQEALAEIMSKMIKEVAAGIKEINGDMTFICRVEGDWKEISGKIVPCIKMEIK
jgi:hypothetical protein